MGSHFVLKRETIESVVISRARSKASAAFKNLGGGTMIWLKNRNLAIGILYWICLCSRVSGRRYNIRELCDIQDGSVRLLLEQGSYVQLDLAVDLDGPGTRCEIVIQTTHKDDGLLTYFENFDFVGTNLATVFRRQDCGATLMRLWDGEFHYLSSCVGSGLTEAPPMSSYSSLGAVKLQLLPANMTGPAKEDAAVAKKPPINFSVIATASQKAVVTDDCPTGCCREPYNFRCPLLNYCIDVKLTCNNITNCGPRVSTTQDENGPICDDTDVGRPLGAVESVGGSRTVRLLGPTDVQRVITVDDPDVGVRKNDMLRPLWAHKSEESFGDAGNTEVPQSFYTRVELVCGIISIILFCLAGIGVLVCRARTNQRNFAASSNNDSLETIYVPSSETSMVTMPSLTATGGQAEAQPRRYSLPGPSGGVAADILEPPQFNVPKRTIDQCQFCSRGAGASGSNVYTIPMCAHHPHCSKDTPPPYESLYPKDGEVS